VTEEVTKIATYPSYHDQVVMVTIQAETIDEDKLSALDGSCIDLAYDSVCSAVRFRL
jgi:hypothetical protein